ncbi:MAG: hypothetical protein Q8R74_04115 [Methylophilus sp.]|nr:hypothetical protein [Methylophilus sp.]
MPSYHHHVSGIFQRHAEALVAFTQLKEKGLPLRRMQIFENDTAIHKASTQAKSNEVLKNMVVKGSKGAVVGAGIGAFAQIALVAANVTLFIASPLVAPLAMLGWGASVGATAGATIGAIKSNRNSAKEKDGWFSDFIRDAIAGGQVVLVVETRSKEETALASEVMKLSVNNYQDISVA